MTCMKNKAFETSDYGLIKRQVQASRNLLAASGFPIYAVLGRKTWHFAS